MKAAGKYPVQLNGEYIAEYRSWIGAKGRCFNHKSKDFKRYGDRGITMCERWRDSFESFMDDMGNKPSSIHSLDRIDVNGPYAPDNCRWATPKEQSWNRRNNRRVNGKPIGQIAFETGIPQATITTRLNKGQNPLETQWKLVDGKTIRQLAKELGVGYWGLWEKLRRKPRPKRV